MRTLAQFRVRSKRELVSWASLSTYEIDNRGQCWWLSNMDVNFGIPPPTAFALADFAASAFGPVAFWREDRCAVRTANGFGRRHGGQCVFRLRFPVPFRHWTAASASGIWSNGSCRLQSIPRGTCGPPFELPRYSYERFVERCWIIMRSREVAEPDNFAMTLICRDSVVASRLKAWLTLRGRI